MKQRYTVEEIAGHVGGTVEGDAARVICGLSSIHKAGPEDITFLEGRKRLRELVDSKAGAVVVSHDVEVVGPYSLVRVSQPTVAWADVVELLRPREHVFTDVSPAAFVAEDVDIGEGVGIGPGAYVGRGVKIGRGTEIHPGVTIGHHTTIGDDCILYAGAHVYHRCTVGSRVILHSGAVIGADGFGFAQENRANEKEPIVHRKIRQIGTVIIEDDVEVGANATVDRAALHATVVGRGTKIDDQVMVGHNCRVGRHCLLVAQVGLSGSVELADYVTIAGQAGLAGHLKVGPRAIIGAKAGVMKDVEPGQVLLGSPALPQGIARRAYSQIQNLPEFRNQISELLKRVAELEKQLNESGAPPEES